MADRLKNTRLKTDALFEAAYLRKNSAAAFNQ